jgi:hypothetical protein
VPLENLATFQKSSPNGSFAKIFDLKKGKEEGKEEKDGGRGTNAVTTD